MLKRGLELRPFELGQSEAAEGELAATAESGIASRRYGRGGKAMKKKKSTDMDATVQRKYPGGWELGESNAIPRDTEFDLVPDPRGGECSFVAQKPGNAMWNEKDRP